MSCSNIDNTLPREEDVWYRRLAEDRLAEQQRGLAGAVSRLAETIIYFFVRRGGYRKNKTKKNDKNRRHSLKKKKN
jgi:hypothetical protein